jgi:hypothetical protein
MSVLDIVRDLSKLTPLLRVNIQTEACTIRLHVRLSDISEVRGRVLHMDTEEAYIGTVLKALYLSLLNSLLINLKERLLYYKNGEEWGKAEAQQKEIERLELIKTEVIDQY